MSRKLLKQAATQWRSNIWLVIEMMIVATAVWYLTDGVFLIVGGKNLPNGYHIENVAVANPITIEGGPLFEKIPDGTDTGSYRIRGIRTIINRLRDLPMVESVGCGQNAIPYNYNFSGNNVSELDRGDSLSIYGNTRFLSPEMVDILQLDPVDGRSREQLKEILRRGDLVLVRSSVKLSTEGSDKYAGVETTDLIGQRFFLFGDSARVKRLGAVVEDMRRNDYEPAFNGNIILPFDDNKLPSDIAVKVRDGRMGEFLDYFRSHRSEFTAGNAAIADFATIDSIREANQADIRETQRNLTVILAFLLVSIFLGILGTFWFRTQERTGEIAIRKVNGATNGAILRRLMGEGVLLLIVGVVLSVGLDWLIVHFELGDFGDYRDLYIPGYGVWQAYPATLGITFVIMCLMVVAGIYFPARRAMAVDPAVALHDE